LRRSRKLNLTPHWRKSQRTRGFSMTLEQWMPACGSFAKRDTRY
jgi:hypothetical protein